MIVRRCFLVMLYVVLFHDEPVWADDKRLILNDPDVLEARWHQMDLTIQNLNSKIASYDNIVAGMQANINGLIHEIKEKDYQIGNLTATVTSLQQKDQSKDSQIGSLTSTVTSLQQKEQTQDSQMGSLTATVTSLQQKVNVPKPGCQTGRLHRFPLPNTLPLSTDETFTFNPPFAETPKLVWGTTYLDSQEDRNLRFRADVRYLTPYSFVLHLETWDNTQIYEIALQWMACS